MRKFFTLLMLLIVCTVWLACEGGRPPSQPPAAATPAPAPTTPKPAASPTATPAAQQVAEGKDLYLAMCAMCHGANGEPDEPNRMRATDLTDKKLQEKWTDDYLKQVIVKGEGSMDAIKGVTDEDVDKLVKYTRTLKK